MPRTLNIEKLEKKFVSLTRSRESIQGLSSWIMHHKEFYQEIVEEWLNALKKEDFNALNMFYVANDVIQHCGKKKAPEYRTAFSTVLEKALSLAKVKEIRSEVTRMLTLWHDKEIYDDNFFKYLENTLNNEPPASEITDEEKELSDSEIISTFKLQNLVEANENLKRIMDEVNCKEAKFRSLKCPESLNVEDLIVRMDKKDTYKQYKKADAYCKYVDDLIASFILLNEARADVLKYLKYTTVFYTTQNEEVKKVVQAYRIYGKKLKIMEKSLSEKMSVLHELFPSPVPESPMSSQSFELSPPLDSPTVNFNQELVNVVDSNQNSLSSNNEYTEDTGHGIYVPTESPREDVENAESMHQENANLSKSTIAKDSQTVEVTAVDALLKSKEEDSYTSEAKSEVESKIKDTEITAENNAANAAEDIDFLLDKAYDERQVKKANIKRKIETLLKTKGSKTCKVSEGEKDEQNGSNLPTKAAIAIIQDSNGGNNFNNTATETISNKENVRTPPYQDADKISEKDAFQSDNSTNTQKENRNQDVSMTDESSCQSKTPKEDTDAGDKNSVPKTCVSTPQSLSDIPLELLKSILDKNLLNTVSSQENTQKERDNDESSGRVSFSHDIACSFTNEKPKDFSTAEFKPDGSIMQTESPQNVSAEGGASSEELTKFKDENQLLNEITDEIDKESAINEMTLCGSKTENMDTEKPLDNEQYNVSKTDVLDNAKSSSFLETLDTTLKCLTANNLSLPNFKDAEKQMPQNTFSDVTFESSLRIYNFLLQCHQAIESKGNHADNLVSNRSEINNTVNDSGNSCVHVNSSVASQNALDNNESSKHDNLELMDMDVDSEDDS